MIGSVDKARADLAQGRVVRRKPALDHVADSVSKAKLTRRPYD